ncbi:MAG: LamG-like jellyroll fold domain-containing protein [Verrucomicrobiales bacterium]
MSVRRLQPAGPCRIYVNGVELPGATDVPPWEWPVDPELLVGKGAPGSNAASFRGELDDLMMFGRGLEPLEIAALAQAGAGGVGPAAPGFFDTDSLQVGADDLLANAPEPAEPGPALRTRFPNVQWVGCDERPGDFVPGHFGHRVRVAAGDVNGDGFVQGAQLVFRWQPKCPMCDIPVTAKLFLDCVDPGEVVGANTPAAPTSCRQCSARHSSPWDDEHLLTDLGGQSTADGSVLVALDLSKLLRCEGSCCR